MKYSLLVTSRPESPGARAALDVAHAILERGHTLHRLFLHQDGVGNAFTATSPQHRDWARLVSDHDIDAVVCVSAAVSRGLIHEQALGSDGEHEGLVPGFVVSGLGQWADALLNSDRVLTFS